MNVQDAVPGPSSAAGSDARMRVSMLIDGEFDDRSSDGTLDALLASDELARFWLDAHRAGDWMRSEEVIGTGDDEHFLRRFSVALAVEPSIVAPRRTERTEGSRSARFWVRTGLPSASIAAALVVVAWVASPLGRNDDNKKGAAWSSAQSSALRPQAPAAVPETPNVVIAKASPSPEPETRASELKAIDPDRLSPYLAAHRDVTPFAYRGPSARPATYNAPVSNSGLSAPQ